MSDLSVIHQQLFNKAPSIFATTPYHKTSSKYTFIPTIDVVDALAKHGFTPAKVSENRTRIADKAGYARHLIRFRNSDILPQKGDLIPEIILTNSHVVSGASAISVSDRRTCSCPCATASAESFGCAY